MTPSFPTPRSSVPRDATGPWERMEYAHHLVVFLRQLVEIVAVEFDGHIATNAGDQFVEAQFDGLADFIKLPELAVRNLFDLFDHIGFGLDARRPLNLRLQDNEAVRNVWRHRIGGDLGGTRLGEHQLQFGEFLDGLLDLELRSEEHTSELQ